MLTSSCLITHLEPLPLKLRRGASSPSSPAPAGLQEKQLHEMRLHAWPDWTASHTDQQPDASHRRNACHAASTNACTPASQAQAAQCWLCCSSQGMPDSCAAVAVRPGGKVVLGTRRALPVTCGHAPPQRLPPMVTAAGGMLQVWTLCSSSQAAAHLASFRARGWPAAQSCSTTSSVSPACL